MLRGSSCAIPVAVHGSHPLEQGRARLVVLARSQNARLQLVASDVALAAYLNALS